MGTRILMMNRWKMLTKRNKHFDSARMSPQLNLFIYLSLNFLSQINLMRFFEENFLSKICVFINLSIGSSSCRGNTLFYGHVLARFMIDRRCESSRAENSLFLSSLWIINKMLWNCQNSINHSDLHWIKLPSSSQLTGDNGFNWLLW